MRFTPRSTPALQLRNRIVMAPIKAGFDGVEQHAANGDLIEQVLALTKALSALGIAYVHVLDHSPLGARPGPNEGKSGMRAVFKGGTDYPMLNA